MNGSLVREIDNILALRRENAQKEAAAKSAQVYAQIPELSKTDRIINMAGTVRAFTLKSVPLPPLTKAMAESEFPELLTLDVQGLDRLIANTKLRKSRMIEQAGFDSSFDKPRYTCPACNDTGRLPDGSRCACFRRILAEKLTETSNLPGGQARFPSFNINCYPEESRGHMASVLSSAKSFAEGFGKKETPNLLFIGNSGVGKTFLAECIANELLGRGIPVLYMPVSTLYTKLSRIHFAGGEEQDNLMRLKDTILNIELLIIDDFGTEKMTESRYEELLEIINTREINNSRRPCRTIITTNLSPREIFDTYGERIASRILGFYDILKFEGDDIRLQSKLR